MELLLKGLHWNYRDQNIVGDIRIRKGLIAAIGTNLQAKKNEKVLQFDNHSIYPGLINAHDHLEMNLYPKSGNPPYGNYTEWGSDIYKPGESPIKEIEKVNIDDRLLWGGIKNLISGATTVVHHNPWRKILSSRKFPVKVLKKSSWSHSLSFGKDLMKSFPKSSKIPFVIHLAEGIDALAYAEVRKLNEMGLLKQNTVLIHAIALTDSDIATLESANASVVWCPASNFFLFNQTTPIDRLKSKVKIALGSDSTLTGSPTLLSEMKFAAQTGLVSTEEIFNQVTSTPAQIFNLQHPVIDVNAPADLLVIPTYNFNYFENLLHVTHSQIELVIINGEPYLSNEPIAGMLGLKKYFAHLNGVRKCFSIDVGGLKKRIQKKTGNVVEQNPLWQMIE